MTGPSSAVYNSRYELRSQVARGGTAQVYLARDLLLDRPVALKVLDPQLSTDHAFVERFRREAQAAANLSHQNIVPVFDWGEADRTYFIVMEYVDGEPLSSIIRTQAPLPPEQAASIAADIAGALAYAHRHGVVHRDVKPGNVLITADGQVKVTDFGIARAIGSDEQVTQTGLVMGTATYFSPEQAQGLGVDGRSDLYALGVVLYEMVTGRPPFTGDTPVAIAYQHVRETPPTPRSLNPSIPAPLEAIILQAMAKSPAERYPTAEDLRQDLNRFLHHQAVTARAASEYAANAAASETQAISTTEALRNVPRSSQRRRTTTPYWIGAGVVLLAAIVVAGILGGRQLGYFGAAHYYTIPDVRGQSVSQAESTLQAKGFNPTVASTVAGTPNQQNQVVSQNPAAETSARSGATIDLTVAGPAPTVSVPNVVNMTVKQARSALKAAKLTVTPRPVPPTNPATQKENQVIRQSPPAGNQRYEGQAVTIFFVQIKSTPVPPVVGDTEAVAVQALVKAGFNIGTTTQQFSPSVPSGTVISMNPAANATTPQGATIALVISEGPGELVPNVLGDSEQQAQAAIQQAGLNYRKGRGYPTQSAGFCGTVAYQDTPAETMEPPGFTVIYRLGVGAGCSPTTTTAITTTTFPGETTTTTFPGQTTTTTFPTPPPA